MSDFYCLLLIKQWLKFSSEKSETFKHFKSKQYLSSLRTQCFFVSHSSLLTVKILSQRVKYRSQTAHKYYKCYVPKKTSENSHIK